MHQTGDSLAFLVGRIYEKERVRQGDRLSDVLVFMGPARPAEQHVGVVNERGCVVKVGVLRHGNGAIWGSGCAEGPFCTVRAPGGLIRGVVHKTPAERVSPDRSVF